MLNGENADWGNGEWGECRLGEMPTEKYADWEKWPTGANANSGECRQNNQWTLGRRSRPGPVVLLKNPNPPAQILRPAKNEGCKMFVLRR